MRVVEDDTKTEDAVPYWKIDDFLGFPGFSWVWVVFRAARAKKVETKRFYLQRSAPIQPKTSDILPKICQKLATTLRVRKNPQDAAQAAAEAAAAHVEAELALKASDWEFGVRG